MKCDELRIENDCVYGPDAKVYLAEQVDEAIAELKQKLHDAEMQADLAECAVTEYKIDCDKLNAENRRLKRALYKACANWAHHRVFVRYKTNEKAWENVERKCQAKMEEYR